VRARWIRRLATTCSDEHQRELGELGEQGEQGSQSHFFAFCAST
jgi:hypothetical protein